MNYNNRCSFSAVIRNCSNGVLIVAKTVFEPWCSLTYMCMENSCCNYGRARPQLLCMSDTPLSCISTKCILNRSYMLRSKHIGKWSFKRGSLKDGLGMYRSASKKVIPKHPLQLYCIKKIQRWSGSNPPQVTYKNEYDDCPEDVKL